MTLQRSQFTPERALLQQLMIRGILTGFTMQPRIATLGVEQNIDLDQYIDSMIHDLILLMQRQNIDTYRL